MSTEKRQRFRPFLLVVRRDHRMIIAPIGKDTMGVNMSVGQGCAALDASLEGLIRQAKQVKRSIQQVQDSTHSTQVDPAVRVSFSELAAFVSETLDDVADRLTSVNGILGRLNAVDSGWDDGDLNLDRPVTHRSRFSDMDAR